MSPPAPIHVQDLGQLAYDQALILQRELNQALIDGAAKPTLLLVEHPPVITLTQRAGPNLLASEKQLAELGVTTSQTDRGGDITYHGPGQLVVYPILKLSDFGLNLSSYMRLLERVVIDTIGQWQITGHNECGATGVWVDQNAVAGDPKRPVSSDQQTSTAAKICAMGVRIRKNTTLHGLALNVAPDLSHFSLIVPCGLEGRPVTSMQALLGEGCPAIQEVKDKLVQTFRQSLAETGKSMKCANGSAPGTTSGS